MLDNTWLSDVSPYDGQHYWTTQWGNGMGYTQRFDTTSGLTWRGNTQHNPIFNNVASITDLGNHRVQIVYNSADEELKPGMCYQMRPTVRDHAGTFFWKSKDVTLSNIDIQFLHGFGMVGQHSENITLSDVDFVAPAGSGRTTAGYADFVQMSGCKGKIDISGCTFSNPHDDPINVHGTFNEVVQKVDDRTFKVQYMHGETAGFPNFFVGDEIEFTTKNTLVPVEDSSAKVVGVYGPDGEGKIMEAGEKIPNAKIDNQSQIIVKLDKDFPDIQANQHVIENVTYTPSVHIHNNVFKETPTRGILVTTRKDVLIENNTFDGMGMAGIFISNDAQNWRESGRTENVTIKNNTFTRGKAQSIFVEPTNPNMGTTIHSNMVIEDNTFYLEHRSISDAKSEKVLDAKSVNNLTFRNNKIYRQNPDVSVTAEVAKNTLKVGESAELTTKKTGTALDARLYKFRGCQNVTISGNNYDGGLNVGSEHEQTNADQINVENDIIAVQSDNKTDVAGKVYYESSDEAVLKVSSTGVVTAVGNGKASIKTYAVAGGRRYDGNALEFEVTGTVEGTLPSGITITTKDETVSKDGTIDYEAEVTAKEGAADLNKTVTWSVVDAKTGANTECATIVPETGVLTANAAGTIEVVARTINGIEARKILVITEDKFELADGFEVRNNQGVTVSPDGLKVKFNTDGVYDTQSESSVIVTKEIYKEDLEATVKVSDLSNMKAWESLGLYFYKDADHYTSVERKTRGNQDARKIALVREIKDGSQKDITETWYKENNDQGQADADSATNVNENTLWLKLKKTGNKVEAFFSTTGKNDYKKVAEKNNCEFLADGFHVAFDLSGKSGNDVLFSDLTINGKPVALTQKSTPATVSSEKLAYSAQDNKLTTTYKLSDEKATAIVKWMIADTKEGTYSTIEGMEGDTIIATKSMKDKWVKAGIIPVTTSGLPGTITYTNPVQITGEGADGGAGTVKSSNAFLKEATMEGLTSSPFASFDKNTFYYHTSATSDEKNVTFNFIPENEKATVKVTVNEEPIAENVNAVNLISGRNTIEAKVTAEDKITSKTYRFIIIRAGDSNGALSTLVVDGQNIELVENQYEYTISTDNSEAAVEATAVSPTSTIEVSVNGKAVKSLSRVTLQAALQPGKNEMIVTVTPETFAAPTRYVVNVKVPDATNTKLETVTFSNGANIKEPFNADTLDYTGTASDSRVTLAATAEEKDATIEVSVNGKNLPAVTGEFNADITLTEGTNKICVKVVSPDGNKNKTYTFNVKASGIVYLSDLDWENETSGDGGNRTKKDFSTDGNPIRLWDGKKEVTFEKGIGSHADSTIVYDIAGKGYQTFTTFVGVDRETAAKPSEANIRFRVLLDGVEKFNSEEMNFSTTQKEVNLDISDVSELTLIMEGVRNTWSAHGDWADAKFTKDFNQAVENVSVNVTANPAEGGTITIDAAGGTYPKGDLATVTATPNEGYQFVKWTVGNELVSESNPYIFKTEENIALVAEFEKVPEPEYVITAESNDRSMGTVAVVPKQETYPVGTTVTFTATPVSEEYEFVNWTAKETGEVVGTEPELIFTVGSEDKSFVANFKKADTFTVTAFPEGDLMGTVAITPPSEGNVYQKGTEITVTATPNEGYEFANWVEIVDGTEVPVPDAPAEYTFVIERDCTLKAVFTPIEEGKKHFTATIRTNDDTMGTVTVEPASENNVYEEGTELTVTAEANEGFEFVNWVEENAANEKTEVSKDVVYTFSITKDTSLVANFKRVKEPVPEGLTALEIMKDIIENQKIPAELSTDMTFPEVPEGFTVAIVKTTPEGIIDFSGKVTTPEKDTEVIVTIKIENSNDTKDVATSDFKILVKGKNLISYMITAAPNDKSMGTVAVTPASEGHIYPEGTEVTVTATPNEGYEFANWVEIADGTEVPVPEASAKYTFAVEKDRTLKAVFTAIEEDKKHFTVTMKSNDDAMGTVKSEPVSENNLYEENTELTVMAEAKEGFEFVNWVEANKKTEVSKDAVYKFKVTKDVSLVANFKKIEEPVQTKPTSNNIMNDIINNHKIPSELSTDMTLPEVPEGFTISIVKTTPEGVIDFSGKVTTPKKDTEVAVTIKIENKNNPQDVTTSDFKVLVKGEKPITKPSNSGTNGNNSGNTNKTQNPGTGDAAQPFGYAAAIVIAFCIILVVLKKKRFKKS